VLVLTGLASEPTSDIKKEPYGSTTLLLYIPDQKKQKRVKKKKEYKDYTHRSKPLI
jgi:hypothetical protein